MHYFAVVLVPTDHEDLDATVGQAMKPFDENESEDGLWDWWQIGGRWTGVFAEYDPTKDPTNWEQCWLCHGTGLRDDPAAQAHRQQDPEYTCNGCGDSAGASPGVAIKWPTDWARYEGDVVRIPSLLRLTNAGAQAPHAFVADGEMVTSDFFNGTDFEETPRFMSRYLAALREHQETHVAVVVDYHS